MQLTFENIKQTSDLLKQQGKKIVFTNGVFDIIHRGHAYYLNRAKELGDILIAGVNSDSSVTRLKGDGRPLNCIEDRIYVLNSLKAVDHTIVFESETPLDLIRLVKPDVLVKGGDYDPEITDSTDSRYIVGSDIVKGYGGYVCVIDTVPGRSTTLTIKKIMGENS